MDSLFSEDPQFRRVQYKKLSDNVREWQQEIGALVAEKLPQELGLDVIVVFQKVDDEKGYAIGTAIAKDSSSGMSVGIPIIVTAWHLAPLDLFFKDSKILPLTDDNLSKVFYQNSLGAGVAPREKPPNMADDTFADMRTPPMGGKYSYSAPMLELIGDTLGVDDYNAIKEAVDENPDAVAALHRRGTFELLSKYAATAKDGNPESSSSKARKSRSMSVFTIKKDGPNTYRLFSAPDGVYDPIIVNSDRKTLRSFVDNDLSAEIEEDGESVLGKVDKNGHYTIVPPKSSYGEKVKGGELGEGRDPEAVDPLKDNGDVVQISKLMTCGVTDRGGVMAKGVVVPNVVNFDGSKKGIKLFLGKSLSAMQDRIAGVPLDDDMDTHIREDDPAPGKTGTLVYKKGDQMLATVPFQVKSVASYNGQLAIRVADYQDRESNLIVSPNIKGMVKMDDSRSKDLEPLLGPGNNYTISAEMSFIPMPRISQVSESKDDFEKLTVPHLDKKPIKVAAEGGRYIFRGSALKKYAGGPFDLDELKRHEAEFLLGQFGMGQEKIAKVLDSAHNRLQLEVHHLRYPEVGDSGTKLASARRAKEAARLRPPLGDILKIASTIEDAQTVDSVLSLGFINAENIDKFVQAQESLWDATHMLSKLLLAARLGMKDIPEDSAKSAIEHIQRVITGLDKLDMLKQTEEKQASASMTPEEAFFNHVA